MTQSDLDASDPRQTILQQLLQFDCMEACEQAIAPAQLDAVPDLAVLTEQGISRFRDHTGDESLTVSLADLMCRLSLVS
jgi:hypothetical protein